MYNELLNRIKEYKENWEKFDVESVNNPVLGIFSSIFELDGEKKAGPFVERSSVTKKEVLFEMGGIGIGLEVSHANIDTEMMNRVIDYVSKMSFFNQLLFFSPLGFKPDAISLAKYFEPIRIELIDFERLDAWVEGIQTNNTDSIKSTERDKLQIAVKDFSLQLAEFVTHDPTVLDRLEWRDVERMLATTLEKLGFKVELTPPAKDGGIDIVLNCFAFGQSLVYFIQVKHWKRPVSRDVIRNFLKVVVEERADRGLVLATTGYTKNAFEGLTKFERYHVQGADSTQMIAICQRYVRSRGGICIPQYELPKVLFPV